MDKLGYYVNIATIATLFVAVIAIFISIWLFIRGKREAKLEVIFDEVNDLINIQSGLGIDGKLVLSYNGQPLDNIFKVRISIKNSGNLPITASDIYEPITIGFGEGVTLLDQPTIIKQDPENLKAEWAFNWDEEGIPTSAILSFDLLNPKWGLVTEFLCTGIVITPKVSMKIKGISNFITNKKNKSSDLMKWLSIFSFFLVLMLLAFFLNKISIFREFQMFMAVIFIITIGFFMRSIFSFLDK